jgi:predicted NBD/HSP70 family sugar kinase
MLAVESVRYRAEREVFRGSGYAAGEIGHIRVVTTA